MEREWVVEESVSVKADARTVYAAVADPSRMREWSPEVFATLVLGRSVKAGTRFIGFNRLGWRLWCTTCQVTLAVPGEAFAFRVTVLGMPGALWGYRVEDVSDDPSKPRTRLTEYWEDLRRDHRGAGFVTLVGRIFTGVTGEGRAGVNRASMRETLRRIAEAVEKG